MKTSATAAASVISECGDRSASKQDGDGCGELRGEWLDHFKALRKHCVRPADEFMPELVFCLTLLRFYTSGFGCAYLNRHGNWGASTEFPRGTALKPDHS